MAELTFRYGVMGTGKTVSLLNAAYNYEKVGLKVAAFAPEKDDRNGVGVITTVNGWKRNAIVIGEKFDIISYIKDMKEKPKAIFVDEAQFISENQIFDFAYVANEMGILTFCYGLLTDFKCELFEGSNALIKCANKIITEPAICECGENATVNMRIVNGAVVTEGAQILLGNVDETYHPVCFTCYRKYCNHEKQVPQRFRKTS